MFERKKALKEIEEKLNTVQMYLENNYKDLTLQSYKDAKEVVERYEKSSLLKTLIHSYVHSAQAWHQTLPSFSESKEKVRENDPDRTGGPI